MSLKIWLPLNGNTNNQGLLDANLGTSSVDFVDGKFGKSLHYGQIIIPAAKAAEVLNNKAITIAFWIYVNADAGNTNNRAMIFGNDNHGQANNNRKFSLFQYPTCNDLHWSWSNDTAGTVFTSGILSGVLPSYKWTHVAITYENPDAKVYINGVLTGTSSGVSNSSSFAYDTTMIWNSNYHMFNDYRIYDNALSAKEVKLLSQGMICHYPMNDVCATSSINKYSGDTVLGKATSTSFTMSRNADGEGYKYTLNYTGTGSSNWEAINYPIVSFEVGKTYDYSCKIRCNSSNIIIQMRSARCGNDWSANMVNVNNADGKWHEYHLKQKMTGTTFERSDSSDVQTTKPQIEFYTQQLSTKGTVYKCDIDIKDVQISECDENTNVPINNNLWADNTVYDTSGFNNHGTATALTLNQNSPRYKYCYGFNGSGQYIQFPTMTLDCTSISFSCWAKFSGLSPWERVFDFADVVQGGGQNVILTINNNNQLSVCGRVNGGHFPDTYTSIVPTLNTWYHFVVTLSGTTCIFYVNGKKTLQFTTNGEIKSTAFTHAYLGKSNFTQDPYFNGSISDFRIYTTALSAQDVQELYNTPVSLSNTGTLMTQGEFIEE